MTNRTLTYIETGGEDDVYCGVEKAERISLGLAPSFDSDRRGHMDLGMAQSTLPTTQDWPRGLVARTRSTTFSGRATRGNHAPVNSGAAYATKRWKTGLYCCNERTN